MFSLSQAPVWTIVLLLLLSAGCLQEKSADNKTVDGSTISNTSNTGVIYVPNQKTNWSRLEPGKYGVSTNSFGLRDREIEAGNSHVFVIGDSFVFGEGVSVEDSIPRRLSAYQGGSFINLGKSGGNIVDYILAYERMRNITKPQYNIIFIYLGNDIMKYEAVRGIRLEDYGHVIGSVDDNMSSCPALPKDPSDLDEMQYENYLKTNRTLYNLATQNRSCFQNDMNPFFLSLALNHPNFLQDTLKNEESINSTKQAIKIFNERIKKNGERALFVFIPEQTQVSERHQNVYRQLNFNLTGMTETDWISGDFMTFCNANQIECLDTLPAFKRSSGKLFYDYDPHGTSEGYDLIARTVSDYLG
jgi:lysophospholipase L1-like esterase